MNTLKKILIAIAAFAAVLLLLYVLRVAILQAAGGYLIYEDELAAAPVVVVLSGDPYDRGREALKLYKEGMASKIVCTGANASHNLLALGTDYIESDLTCRFLLNHGVDSLDVVSVREGTSTLEECGVIINYCETNRIDTVIVVSTRFHTRRVHNYFAPRFAKHNIKLIVRGASSSLYREDNWWKFEDGMIMVNNEYMKLLYYRLHY